jgi:hypothetical protein
MTVEGVSVGQAQMPEHGDASRSRATAQTQPTPRPRLKRCPCCLSWKRAPDESIRYRVVRGSGVYTGLLTTPPDAYQRGPTGPDELEIERVTLVSDSWGNAGYRYEAVRGGRWVDWWHARYGRHANESKEWSRTPQEAVR